MIESGSKYPQKNRLAFGFFYSSYHRGGAGHHEELLALENTNNFFSKQVVWVLLGFLVFFTFSFIDFRFLKRTPVLVFIYIFTSFILLSLFILGSVAYGAKSWFDFGFFSFQPVDMMKLVLVLILAKYFSRRHVEIRN